MKVTKYPHRFTISLSETEMALLRTVVNHGLADFSDDDQIRALNTPLRRLLRTNRWQAIGGPLMVDHRVPGRGGWAQEVAAQ